MIEKNYDPSSFESAIYQLWEQHCAFSAEDISEKESFYIPMPPPNVTGVLHNGHALFIAIQDLITRWQRMQGKNTLWLPGIDHAGIATQMVVEKSLHTQKKTRFDLGREAFVEEIWNWKAEKGNQIFEQMRSLGASCDWDRSCFTMDSNLQDAVTHAFITLYQQGLIYRAKRMTNHCFRCKTVLSDLEVISKPQNGTLWHLSYFLDNSSQKITIATSRPETIFADTAIAVHPHDTRYQNLIGKKVCIPLLAKYIPIIPDERVDPAFGSGALKVTPAHSFEDYEIGQTHQLEIICLLDEKGILNKNAAFLEGLTVQKAREKILLELKQQGFIEKEQTIEHAINVCSRCEHTVEPYLSDQWFVKTQPLAQKAIQAAQKGEKLTLKELEQHEDAFKILPESWTSTFYQWMYNIRDWCISRQLWWGHRIPAWYCQGCAQIVVDTSPPTECISCQHTTFHQDEDVLDTWFSSGLWPFSALGWPHATEALKTFYPAAILETGFDILFFWVARMLMLGIHFTGKIPFRRVYLHAMVRDEKGQKMSKTKGNVIDPLEIIQKYGADAFRFTLLSASSQGRDIKLSEQKIVDSKAFCNKLWNAARYVLLKCQDSSEVSIHHLLNQWILHQLHATAQQISHHLEHFQISHAVNSLYTFVWNIFCDWYIEYSKVLLADPNTMEETKYCLRLVLSQTLALAHPFIPFITEHIYASFHSKLLIHASYPHTLSITSLCPETLKFIDQLQLTIESLRAFLGENNLSSKSRPTIFYKTLNPKIEPYLPFIQSLAGIGTFKPYSQTEKVISEVPTEFITFFIALDGLVNPQEEYQRVMKQQLKLQKDIAHIEKKFTDQGFLKKAPESFITIERQKLEALKKQDRELQRILEKIKSE